MRMLDEVILATVVIPDDFRKKLLGVVREMCRQSLANPGKTIETYRENERTLSYTLERGNYTSRIMLNKPGTVSNYIETPKQ